MSAGLALTLAMGIVAAEPPEAMPVPLILHFEEWVRSYRGCAYDGGLSLGPGLYTTRFCPGELKGDTP